MLVTILAFIFIPLSLATSIFSMDIQELNSSGQSIWVFLATAGAILLSAFFIWGIFYQWLKYMHAPRSSRERVFLSVRLKLFFWLVFHGHIIWVWRSGITFSLLTSGRIGFTPTCNRGSGGCYARETISASSLGQNGRHKYPTHSAHGPCAYIQAHREERRKTAFSFSAAV